MAGVTERIASSALALLGEDPAEKSQHRRLFGHVLLGVLILLPTLPVLLMTLTGPRLALPVGFALAGAVGLLSAGLVLSLANPQMPRPMASSGPASEFLDELDGLITIHDQKGQILSVYGRDHIRMMRGKSNSLGLAFVDEIHVSDRIAFLSSVDGLRSGQKQASVDVRLEHRRQPGAGQYRPVRIDMTAHYDDNGEFCGFLAQTTDRTQAMRMRSEIIALEEDVRSAHDTKTRFLAAVSHELRTPLNAILGFSDILIGGYFGTIENERQAEYIRLIHQSGHHLLGVVTSMLDMSRIEVGRYEISKQSIAVRQVFKACEEMLSLEAKTKGVVLIARMGRDVGQVVADPGAFQQILINLVGNAIKFTNSGGVVSMDATCDARTLTIRVTDTGIGIPADRIGEIGQPFMQVESAYARKYQGTGLGLSLVKGLVALHGGSFDLASIEGEGTAVTISLPLDGEVSQNPTLDFPPRLMHVASPVVLQGGAAHGRAKTA